MRPHPALTWPAILLLIYFATKEIQSLRPSSALPTLAQSQRNSAMTPFCRSAAVASILVFSALTSFGQSAPPVSPMTPDMPPKFTAPRTGYDYVKRVEMMPMRDGVKLYTVIVDPQRRDACPHPAHPHALQRRRPRRAQRIAAHARRAAAGRRRLRQSRIHPRLSGCARQVRIGGRVRHDASAHRPAQPQRPQRHHRRVRHHRLAGEECPRDRTAKSACSALPTKDSPSSWPSSIRIPRSR